MQNKLTNYIKELGADIVGYSNVNFDKDIYYTRLEEKKEASTLFPRGIDTANYIDVYKYVENAKLIISIGISFQNANLTHKGEYIGYYSKIAYGKDYHKVMYPILNKVVAYLKQYKSDIEYYLSCDTKDIDDKFFACICSNGSYGRNSLIINEEYGCEVVYGTIICDLGLDISSSLKEDLCKDCRLCEIACPAKCLNDYSLNYNDCITYKTQSKNFVEYNKMNGSVYGCDICLNVCPYNKINKNNHFFEDKGYVQLIDLLEMSNAEYNEYFKDKSLLWLNKNIIKKNAIMLLKEYVDNNDNYIIDYLKEYKKRTDSVLLQEAIDYSLRG